MPRGLCDDGAIISILYLLIGTSGYILPLMRTIDDSGYINAILTAAAIVYIAISTTTLALRPPSPFDLPLACVKSVIGILFFALEVKRLASFRGVLYGILFASAAIATTILGIAITGKIPQPPTLSLANKRILLWLVFLITGILPLGLFASGVLLFGSVSQLARVARRDGIFADRC